MKEGYIVTQTTKCLCPLLKSDLPCTSQRISNYTILI